MARTDKPGTLRSPTPRTAGALDVLAVAGYRSGAGKTLLIERLLAGPLSGWGALKTTPEPERHGTGDDYVFVTTPLVLDAPGTDTRRYRDAGAARVAWLSSHRAPDATETGTVLSHFVGLPGVVIEGNRLARPFSPAAWILVTRAGTSEIKAGAEELLDIATWLAVQTAFGSGAGELPDAIRRRVASAGPGFAFTLDASDPADPGTAALASAVTAWLRSRRGTRSPSRPRC